jgi:hypothetical protein
MITEIFTTKELPKCSMSVRRTISADMRIGSDQAVRYVKRDMAIALAEAILEDSRFFESEHIDSTAAELVGIRLDCIVLNEGELRSLLKDAFVKGVEQGRCRNEPNRT